MIGDDNVTLSAFDSQRRPAAGLPDLSWPAEVKGTPALCDCDGDGMSEIVTVGWDGHAHFWDYDFPFSPTRPAAVAAVPSRRHAHGICFARVDRHRSSGRHAQGGEPRDPVSEPGAIRCGVRLRDPGRQDGGSLLARRVRPGRPARAAAGLRARPRSGASTFPGTCGEREARAWEAGCTSWSSTLVASGSRAGWWRSPEPRTPSPETPTSWWGTNSKSRRAPGLTRPKGRF